MKIATSQCGALVDFNKCVELYGLKGDYYGEYTKCPIDGCLVYEGENSRCKGDFDKDGDEDSFIGRGVE